MKETVKIEKEPEDNAASAYSVTAESYSKMRRKSEDPRGRSLKILKNSAVFDNRGSSISSASSTISILMREDTQEDNMDNLHSFSLKKSISTERLTPLSSLEKDNTCKKQSFNATGSNSKVFHIQETYSGSDESIKKTYKILVEIMRQIIEFKTICFQPEFAKLPNAAELSMLKTRFDSEQEIDEIRQGQKFKLNSRNFLGIKSSEDWIYNLYIGNVMHLSPLAFDEIQCSLVIDSLKSRSHQELSKDMLLEKLVLLTVGYFCIGTEIRFMKSKLRNGISKEDKTISEIWLAKGLHTAITFLPSNCPLVEHVKSSYMKHYCRDRMREVKDIIPIQKVETKANIDNIATKPPISPNVAKVPTSPGVQASASGIKMLKPLS